MRKLITISFVADFQPSKQIPDPGTNLAARVHDAISPWYGAKSNQVDIAFGNDDVLRGHLTAINIEDDDGKTYEEADTPDKLVPHLREVWVRPGFPREWSASRIAISESECLRRNGWTVTYRRPGGPWIIKQAESQGVAT